MSLSITVTQAPGFFKKEINARDLIGDCYECGFRDKFYRLRDEHYKFGTLVVYDPDHIGKGVAIAWEANRKEDMRLDLEYPCTKYDIDVLYQLVQNICQKWKTTTFIQNETEYQLEEIEELKETAKRNAISHLAWNQGSEEENGIVYIQGAMWPLYVKQDAILEYAHNQDEEGFASFLHAYQNHDLYYACPMVYRLPDLSGYFGIFAITATTDSIIPIVPKEPPVTEHEEGISCDFFVVSLVSLDEKRVIGRISYADFLQSVDAVHLEKFDERHYLLPGLSEEELHHMATLQDPLKPFEE